MGVFPSGRGIPIGGYCPPPPIPFAPPQKLVSIPRLKGTGPEKMYRILFEKVCCAALETVDLPVLRMHLEFSPPALFSLEPSR